MINKAIFDSGIFIGTKLDRDQYNEIAITLIEQFVERHISKILITTHVLAECVNFMLKKSGFQKANEMLEYLTETDRIEISDIDISAIKPIFIKYKNLSITDCSLIALSEKLKIKEIFSFDRHFDSVKGITRLTSL